MPRLDLVGVVASDMARSVDFYRRLGLEFPEGAENEAHVEATVAGIRFAIDRLDVVQSFDPDWEHAVGPHHCHAGAFLCDSPADVDATYASLVEAGFGGHKEPWDAFWGQRYAQMLDPDGYLVDLFAPLPQSV